MPCVGSQTRSTATRPSAPCLLHSIRAAQNKSVQYASSHIGTYVIRFVHSWCSIILNEQPANTLSVPHSPPPSPPLCAVSHPLLSFMCPATLQFTTSPLTWGYFSSTDSSSSSRTTWGSTWSQVLPGSGYFTSHFHSPNTIDTCLRGSGYCRAPAPTPPARTPPSPAGQMNALEGQLPKTVVWRP